MVEALTGLIALSPDGMVRSNMVLRSVCARALGLEPLPFEVPTEPASSTEPLLAEFAEQFSTDVAGVSEAQRSALMSAFGTEVLTVTALCSSPISCRGCGPGWVRSGWTFRIPTAGTS